jgi:hypothetical protein
MKPLWHVAVGDIKCIHTFACFKECNCGKSGLLGAGSYGTCTLRSLCMHYTLTMHALCTHYALTMHSLCTHYALTIGTVHHALWHGAEVAIKCRKQLYDEASSRFKSPEMARATFIKVVHSLYTHCVPTVPYPLYYTVLTVYPLYYTVLPSHLYQGNGGHVTAAASQHHLIPRRHRLAHPDNRDRVCRQRCPG